MTQIIRFKCVVVCGHRLGEEQYYIAYEELRKVANQITSQMLQEHMAELEIEHLKGIQGVKHV